MNDHHNLDIQITYCVEWGYKTEASSMAAAIKSTFGVMAGFIEGHHGIFEVTINSKVIYTNQKQCGRLPRIDEVLHEINTYKDLLPKKGQ